MKYNQRQQVLEEYGLVLNPSSPELFFKQTLELAANICNTPVAYISILGDKKQYIISQYGSNFQTIDKKESICQFTIQGTKILVINDTSADERTKSLNITKGKERVGFYAGFPLIDKDLNNLGALCVTDYKSGTLDEKQKRTLEILGQQVIAFLNLRKSTIAALINQGEFPIEQPNTVDGLIHKLNDSTSKLRTSNTLLKSNIETYQKRNKELNTLTNEFPGTVSKLNKEYVYTFTNKKYENLTGLSYNEIRGKHVSEIVGQEIFEKLKPLYDRVLDGERLSMERFFEFENGKRFLRVTYVPAYNDSNNQINGLYVFSEDLTGIKSFQSQLENSNEKLEHFGYMICHDLQSPLRTISSFGGLLERDLKNKKIEFNTEYLDFMIQGAKQASKLVSDLLEFAKAGNNYSSKKEISFLKICDNVLLNLFEQIKREEAQISLPKDDVMLYGYKSDFIILIQNFISNGIKYRRPEVTPEIKIQAFKKAGKIVISIKDNGLGIPSEKTAEIFEPFKRLAEYSHIEGTGIGLATCSKILKKYESDIKVESKCGQGTCFTFEIESIIAQK